MSSGLPYLQKLRKAQLAEFAELTDLQDYEDDNKPDLAIKLDNHLQANSSIFGSEQSLADYYRRTSQASSAASPTKRGSASASKSSRAGSGSGSVQTPIKAESSHIGSGARSARRRQTQARAEAEPSDVPASAPSQPLIDVAVRKTGAVTPAQPLVDVATQDVPQQTPVAPLVEVAAHRRALPASPAVVTEAIERQTTAWRQSIGQAWEGSGVQERSDSLRETLSSVKAVQVIVTLLEAFSLIKEVLPLRYLATFPAIDAINTPAIPVKIPDLFVLVDSSFWAPVSLWILTSIILPLTVAYFFNINLRVAQTNITGIQTRRSSSINRTNQTTFDPLSFNISKAIVAYIVYAHGFTFWSVWGRDSLVTVNASIPFQYAGILTGAAICAVGALYEAILRK
ncbi:uncharacterized protein BDV17DRAFT_292693 [Aspergillus undulatus]|uniref:uncharacterized protein n=1 Tax=Aspergillus undulatus TaxID=1810928 RepID=UPI003CCC99E8